MIELKSGGVFMANIIIKNQHYPIKAILFDKDGTITELGDFWTEPTIGFMNRIVNDFPNKTYHSKEKEEIFLHAGIKGDELLPDSLATAGSMKDFANFLADYSIMDGKELYQEALAYFCKYIEQYPERIKPLGDLAYLFERLKTANLLIGLVTNDSLQTTHLILEKLEIKDFFSFVATPNEFPEKPSRVSLDAFCEQFQCKPEEVVYVGDSLGDMAYGQHTLASIAVMNHPSSQAALIASSQVQIGSVMDLLSLIECD